MKKGALAGSMLLAASLLSGCRPDLPAPVYGPPPETVTPEPSFRAEDNLPAPVYGPPEFFDPDYDPENNIPEDVYGPPSFFGLEDEEPGDEPAEAPAPEETEAQP